MFACLPTSEWKERTERQCQALLATQLKATMIYKMARPYLLHSVEIVCFHAYLFISITRIMREQDNKLKGN